MSLDLEVSPYTAILREVATILKESPLLGCVKSWKEFVGKPDDFQVPPISGYPSIAVNFSSTGMSPWSQGGHEETMIITFEIAVNSSDAADLLNLWWAVLKSLSPHKLGRKRIVAKAGKADSCTIIGGVDLSESALKHTIYRDDMIQVGVGSIAVNMIIKE